MTAYADEDTAFASVVGFAETPGASHNAFGGTTSHTETFASN